jgi:hypothetical protein
MSRKIWCILSQGRYEENIVTKRCNEFASLNAYATPADIEEAPGVDGLIIPVEQNAAWNH